MPRNSILEAKIKLLETSKITATAPVHTTCRAVIRGTSSNAAANASTASRNRLERLPKAAATSGLSSETNKTPELFADRCQ
jgi:hypothetical protein